MATSRSAGLGQSGPIGQHSRSNSRRWTVGSGSRLSGCLRSDHRGPEVFPTQELRTSYWAREFTGPDYLIVGRSLNVRKTSQLILENPSDSPIINTGRLHVRLVRALGPRFQKVKWDLLPSCPRNAITNNNPEYYNLGDAVSVETWGRDSPFPGNWNRSQDNFFPLRDTKLLEWEWDFENPWFPSVLIQGPEVFIVNGGLEQYRWVVTWWSERQGPEREVVRLQ
jgi:hypothetical protein